MDVFNEGLPTIHQIPTPYFSRYIRLLSARFYAKVFTVGSISSFQGLVIRENRTRRSVDRWLRSISPRLFDLETADCEKIYIQELMRYNTEEYGGPHSKITNHIRSTLPKLLKVYNHGLNEQGELTLTLALNNAQ